MKMKSFRLLTVLLTVVMMVALSLNIFAAQSNVITKDGLTAQLFTDKDSYKAGETVKASVQVDNRTNKEVFVFTQINVPESVKLAGNITAYDARLLDGETWTTPNGTVTTGIVSAVNSSAATGDNMQAGLWIVLIILAICGIVALLVYGKNKKTWLSVMLCMAMVAGMVVTAVPAYAADMNGDIELSCTIQVDGRDETVAAVVSYVIYDEVEEAEESAAMPTEKPAESEKPVETEPPATDAPATEPPATETPAETEAPAEPTDAPTEEPVVTESPAATETPTPTPTVEPTEASVPNVEAVLWNEFVPAHEDGTIYSGTIQRLGHDANGTPYILFAQNYRNTSPSVTRWVSEKKGTADDPNWLTLTFEEAKTINKVELYFVNQNVTNGVEYFPMMNYEISYKNGEDWVSVVTVNHTADDYKSDGEKLLSASHALSEAVTTTQIRVKLWDNLTYTVDSEGNVTLGSAANYSRLNEIEVYDTEGNNIATSATAEADSRLKKYPDALMNDGFRASYADWWEPTVVPTGEVVVTGEADEEWLQLDLGEAKTFNEIHFESVTLADAARSWFIDFKLQYNNGTAEAPEWVTIKEETGYTSNKVIASLEEAVTAQYIRFLVTKGNAEEAGVKTVNYFKVYNTTQGEQGAKVLGDNLAVGATAMVSTGTITNPPDSVTRWVSGTKGKDTAKNHAELTFAEAKTINQIDLYFTWQSNNGNGIQYFPVMNYCISYWNDNAWVEIVNKTDNTELLSVSHTLEEAITTTQIRVELWDNLTYTVDAEGNVSLGNGANYSRFNEIEVFDVNGVNVAYGATIAVDSANKKYSAMNAIDGWRSTSTEISCFGEGNKEHATEGIGWQLSAAEIPGGQTPTETIPSAQWLVVDFGEKIDVNEMHIMSVDDEDDRSWFKNYALQYNKGTAEEPEWVTVKSDTENYHRYASAVFETVNIQQVRFLVNEGNAETGGIPKICSFAVYNRTAEGPGENLTQRKGVTVTASSSDASKGNIGEVAIRNAVSQQISCLTAVSLEGEVLWQKGTPVSENYTCGSDLPIQIYDIDRDGVEEIITVYNNAIQIFSPDGALETYTPCTAVHADAIVICNLRGLDYPQDILVKDRYFSISAYGYNNDTKSIDYMWWWKNMRYYSESTEGAGDGNQMVGHFPYPYDIDDDGKDEIMTGNSFVDIVNSVLEVPSNCNHSEVLDNGKVAVLYDYIFGKSELIQHADAVKVGDFDPNQPGYEIILIHSMNGNIFVNQYNGRYMFDLAVGHSQKGAVGDFVPTIPGQEIFTSIKEATALYLHSANGKRIWPSAITYDLGGVIQIDPAFFIKAGSGQEYLLAPRLHEVIDGYNNAVVELPEDSPRFGWAINIFGDEREELLLWSNQMVQIWTNAAVVPDGGKNLAKDATITTDSTEEGYQVSALNDGDRTNAMWMSKDTLDDHYIIVDFGTAKTFDELWLYHHKDGDETYYLDNFRLQYNAGTAEAPQWTDIYDVKANMKKEAAFSFAPVTAQQVRVLITDPTTARTDVDSAARVCEIEIYEALTDDYTPVSGTLKAGVIDFGGSKQIDGVVLTFEGEVTGYTLQYNSGTAEAPVWTDLAADTYNTAATDKYAFTPVTTNALRVVVTKGNGAVTKISAREYSDYDYQTVTNEVIINKIKYGSITSNTSSHRWTNY